MRFYQLMQYGRLCCTHCDKEIITEKDLKEVCKRIVAKAKESIKNGVFSTGAFEVIVCNDKGVELDNFFCSTDSTYS